jgi:hypothetical protein
VPEEEDRWEWAGDGEWELDKARERELDEARRRVARSANPIREVARHNNLLLSSATEYLDAVVIRMKSVKFMRAIACPFFMSLCGLPFFLRRVYVSMPVIEIHNMLKQFNIQKRLSYFSRCYCWAINTNS